MIKTIKKIAVLTSGGDAPGMNATIRSVTRTALINNIEVVGVQGGYKGLLNNQIMPLYSYNVSKTIQRGGTFLHSSRCDEFKSSAGRSRAYDAIEQHRIDALVVIGGDGSLTGAKLLSQEYNLPIVGVPGTIDNDLYGADFTIGYDTAINTALESIDKIRDTADSHNRIFIVEVMGRNTGYIAGMTAIGAGAELCICPEYNQDIDDIMQELKKIIKYKNYAILVVAESPDNKSDLIYAKAKDEIVELPIRLTKLGHIQRGGSPTAYDRYLGSILGIVAVEALIDGESSVMVGLMKGEVAYTPFEDVLSKTKHLDKNVIKTFDILSK